MNIHDYDLEMDNTKFSSKVDNIYVLLMSGVMFDELENVKHKVSSDVYKKYEAIVLNNKAKNFTQTYDELNVKSTNIINIEKTEDKIIVTVELISGYVDYVTNNVNDMIVSGNDTIKKFHRNILTLEKRLDAYSLKSSMHCPSCGNPINYNADGTCDYCGTVFNTEKYDYILTDIKESSLV